MSVPIRKSKSTAGDVVRAEREVLLDDAQTRITQWRFAPGAETGWHRHTHDYVTIQQSGGALRLENAEGDITEVPYREGRAVRYAAPIEHNATNISDVEVRVLEIEFK